MRKHTRIVGLVARIRWAIIVAVLLLSTRTRELWAAPPCVVPTAGNWVITADCDLLDDAIAPQNVAVQNNATLSVPENVTLSIDYSTYALRVINGSTVHIANGGRIHYLPVAHKLINKTDGQVGYYLKRVNGPVLEAYQETFAFYPASAIKVMQHLHAIRAVEAGTVNLNTMLIVCATPPSNNVNCTDSPNSVNTCSAGLITTETLMQSLQNMMIPSSNQSSNAIQELFGNGTPSVGRAAINRTANGVVGMSTASALQHKFACNNVANNPFNTLTLVDLGLLYEQVATNTRMLQPASRTTFYQLMLNETNNFFIASIINDEANNLGLSDDEVQAFSNQVRMAHKAGAIPSPSGTIIAYESIGGWLQLPINGGTDTRDYVYGYFVHGATTNTPPGISTVAGELLRGVIRAALETW